MTSIEEPIDPIDQDEPGAPPGYLLDPDDIRTACIHINPADLERDDDADLLAQGAGEVEDEA